MGILRSDRVSGLGGANAINGSTFFGTFGGATYGNQIEIQRDSELDIGDGNLTVECWFNSPHTSGYQSILGQEFYNNFTSDKVSFNFYLNSDGIYLWNRESGSVSQKFGVTSLWVASTWNHVAWVREGTGSNENKIYLNGSLVGSAFTNDVTYSSEQKYHIGGNFYSQTSYGQYPYKGHISNLRMSNIARYTANFTVPTTRLEKDANTILLTCQSPSNILKEETGKILSHNTRENNTPAQASRFAPDVGEDHGTTFGDNTVFDTLSYMVPPGGRTDQRGRGRGIFADGDQSKTIEYISIQSLGNAIDFGDSTTDYKQRASVSSSTRTVTAGGFNSPSFTNVIEYITIATTSNATDFGDLTLARRNIGGAGNSTRGIYFGGGSPSVTDTIDYVTIATTGNATDFGNTTAAKQSVGALASPTRAVFGGGQDNTIEYLTIATTGNGTDFGDLISGTTEQPAGTSSSTRGLFICGESQPSGTKLNTIQYITIASTGNATDFGDNTFIVRSLAACNNSLRAVYGGGNLAPASATTNALSYVTIATTGNGQDFGDLIGARNLDTSVGSSDSHGGIS